MMTAAPLIFQTPCWPRLGRKGRRGDPQESPLVVEFIALSEILEFDPAKAIKKNASR